MVRAQKIFGVILAAGASERMGSPKWQVSIAGKTFLEHILDSFNEAGISDIFVVFQQKILSQKNFIPLFNPHPERGQLSSLKIALEALPHPAPFLMQLVDRPLVKSDTFRNIIDEFDGRSIVIPTFGGKKGHPVLFPSEMRNILLKTEDKSGIRAAIANYNSRVKYLEVRDEAILWNIDTKEDLKKCQMR